MKKLIFSALALMGCVAAGAQSRMILTSVAGSTNSFDLANVSKLTFTDGGTINVYDKLGASSSFDLADVRKIVFEGDFAAIATTKAEPKAGVSFAYDGSVVRIGGIDKPTAAYVCSTSGAVVERKVVADGEAVNVSGLAKGVYVVVAGGQSFKFVK